MRTLTCFSLALVSLLLCDSARAVSYSGQWEYRALNAGDTNFNVEQVGDDIKFYRVLYPEYHGSHFKLEHIYKGKLKGKSIAGFLFVREEGMKDFEKLRDFTGEIKSANEMVVDDLPLVRSMSKKTNDVSVSDSKPEPKFSKVVFAKDARKKQSKPAIDGQESPESSDTEKRLPSKSKKISAKAPPGAIPRLIPVNREIDLRLRKKTDKMLAKADALYSNKKYEQALKEYSSAYREDRRRLELLYKLGLCHGVLGNRDARTGKTAQAIVHYTKAVNYWTRATRLDPYNEGAKENIRRAKLTISKLKNG